MKKKPAADLRRKVTVLLPPIVIAALQRDADEEASTLTDQIECRLIDTLITEGRLDTHEVIEKAGRFASLSVAVSL